MGNCFDLLGIEESATKEQILEAYERKKSLYSGTFFEEDPKYAKRKLEELREALNEAYLAGNSTSDLSCDQEQIDALRQILSEDEMLMQELYHKHLTGRINRLAGTSQKKVGNAKYKGTVLLFWGAIVVILILIGFLL